MAITNYYLNKKAPNTSVTHVARGLLNFSDINRFQENIILITCRNLTCLETDSSSLVVFYEQPYLICSHCGSVNITIEWLEHRSKQIIIPCGDFNIYENQNTYIPPEGSMINEDKFIEDEFYQYVYHQHYQRLEE